MDCYLAEAAVRATTCFDGSAANGALYISNFAFLDAKSPALLRIR